MARRRARTVCSVPGCPQLTDSGRCAQHRAEAEQQRGSARQRGYGAAHEQRFRPGVLARDPVCVLCQQAPSQHADHYPRSRRELAAAGLNPDDPQYGRGLCQPCHARETARHQPGGWNQ
ncbi:holin [Actinacidiphila sp. ITFR-21]|uniref:holin n=1 Tax=Actinacidiphila sp. ITFR-21 TaxID=3075199 RepID=UPI00288A821B|nr:holin [Streptomyces sp. ITFR-21]WNI16627.1 holin [Streptomyces sp. ITFR-21]